MQNPPHTDTLRGGPLYGSGASRIHTGYGAVRGWSCAKKIGNTQAENGRPGWIDVFPASQDRRTRRSHGRSRRFMAVVGAPWINKLTNAAAWGFHCIGCKKQYRSRPLHWRRKYCLETFDDHIEQCGRIVNGQHCLADSATRER